MKRQPKKGGGTLREYRAFGYRVIVETFSERTAKRWQVTAYRRNLAQEMIDAVPYASPPESNGSAPAPTEVTP